MVYLIMSTLEIAKKLEANDLTRDELMIIQALGFRAYQTGSKEVEAAVGIVICALQGNYGLTEEELRAKYPTTHFADYT